MRITLKGAYRRWSKKKNPWSSAIGINGKTVVLGVFKTETAAHRAYLKARREHPAMQRGGARGFNQRHGAGDMP